MKKKLHLILCLIITGCISCGILTLADGVIGPIIEKNENSKKFGALEVIFPGAQFEEIFVDGEKLVKEAYIAKDQGYVYKIANQGFASMLEYLLGIDNNGNIIAFVEVSNNETQGYGTRISTEEFTGKVIGKTTSDTIDTLSGATVSSTAMINAMYEAFAIYNESAGIDGPTPETPKAPEGDIAIPSDNLAMVVDSTDTTVTYEVVSKGMGDNTIHVVLNLSDLTIESIKYVDIKDTPDYVTKVNNEEYLGLFVGKNLETLDTIDVISGATLSSDAIKNAARIALNTANNTYNESNPYKPYIIEQSEEETTYGVKIKSIMGENTFAIKLNNNNEILSVEFIEIGDTEDFVKLVNNKEYLDQFIGKTSSTYEEVDIISGATGTSNSIKDAINMILSEFNGLDG